jgi:hypothetical protein
MFSLSFSFLLVDYKKDFFCFSYVGNSVRAYGTVQTHPYQQPESTLSVADFGRTSGTGG